ncbi:unnamed protein product [Strongylus vulgaris]|uniref:Uncharacterized protein n=1 Tax=Strongylus vulgaris TaxID=40348 RepID=A0A3P7IVL1_STRVU|nr:unnamed protein product [Strongylus vulgaris]
MSQEHLKNEEKKLKSEKKVESKKMELESKVCTAAKPGRDNLLAPIALPPATIGGHYMYAAEALMDYPMNEGC